MNVWESDEMGEWGSEQDVSGYSMTLIVEIKLDRSLKEECTAQTVMSLRQLADRIANGEKEGIIFDGNLEDIGYFDCLPEVIYH